MVCSIIWAASLARAVRSFRKRAQKDSCFIGDADAVSRTGALVKLAANPKRALIQVRQELGADDAAKCKENTEDQAGDANSESETAMVNGPCDATAVSLPHKFHRRIFPFPCAFTEQNARQNRSQEDGVCERAQ